MPFVNRRFTNGVAFLSNMVYKSMRGGTSGPKDGASPYETFVEYPYPPPPPGGIKAARIIFLAVVGAIGIDRTMILILATVDFVRGKNCCFWSHLASSRRKADIFCTNNQTPSNCFEYSLISNNPNAILITFKVLNLFREMVSCFVIVIFRRQLKAEPRPYLMLIRIFRRAFSILP